MKRPANVYIIGGGIGTLAAAAFLIREGQLAGYAVTVLQEPDTSKAFA